MECFFCFNQMPRVPDASSFTRHQKIAAQTISTATKNPTQVSVPSASLVLNGTVGATVKTTTVAAKASPSTSLLATSTLKGNTAKRG